MEPSTLDERRMTVVLLKDTTAIRLEIRLISVITRQTPAVPAHKRIIPFLD